jgi:hypothetical protein
MNLLFQNLEEALSYFVVTLSYVRNRLPEAYRVISWSMPPTHSLSLDSGIAVTDFVNVVNSVPVARRLSRKETIYEMKNGVFWDVTPCGISSQRASVAGCS